MVAVADSLGGFASAPIYTSTDGGVNWTARDSSRDWVSVASSSDGSKLIATAGSDQIYTSTDAGVTRTARDSARAWCGVALSSDGRKRVAGVFSDQLYTSSDSGVTWTARDSARRWLSVASSSDGVRLVALTSINHGQIYTSVADRTTPGTTGSLVGGQSDAPSLQYIENNLVLPLSAASHSGSFTVN